MWFLLWLLFFFVLFTLPLGYGWGYRGWGAPPGPRWRGDRRVVMDEEGRPVDVEPTWGWLGDFLWAILIVSIVWLIVGLFV